jgi:hypothetical protein
VRLGLGSWAGMAHAGKGKKDRPRGQLGPGKRERGEGARERGGWFWAGLGRLSLFFPFLLFLHLNYSNNSI